MKKKVLKSFRFHPNDLAKLKRYSKQEGVDQTRFLESCLHKQFWEIEQKNAA